MTTYKDHRHHCNFCGRGYATLRGLAKHYMVKHWLLSPANLKLSTTAISLRLPKWMLERIKAMANERDVPYQSLIKTFLYDRVKEELAPPQANRKDI